MAIKHSFTNPKSDEADATITRPSDWNADHISTVFDPDIPPTSPSAYDDEFTALSGWTTLGSFDTSNVSDALSMLHLKKASTGVQYNGIYKTAPSTPFTATIRINDFILETQYQSLGLLLTEASPGKLAAFDMAVAGGSWYFTQRRWTNRTTFSTSVDLAISTVMPSAHTVKYMRIICASSSDVTLQWSFDGLIWQSNSTLNNMTTNLTIANVGIGISVPVSTSVTNDVFVDWIRFT